MLPSHARHAQCPDLRVFEFDHFSDRVDDQPGSMNSLVYTLATNMGIIVACNGGGFGFFGDGGLVVDSGRGVTGGGGMFWAAPAEGSGDVRCRALCGNQDGMWVAPELTITEASEITTNTQHLGTITRQLV